MPVHKAFSFFGYLALTVSLSTALHAQEEMRFKRLKFGMDAIQVAFVTDGPVDFFKERLPDSKFPCPAAIGTDWTYGGIGGWEASCVEENDKEGLPAFQGLYMLGTYVLAKDSRIASLGGEYVSSAKELADIYSEVFGQFHESDSGKKFTASRGGATVSIQEEREGTQDHGFWIRIISDRYVAKKVAQDEKKEDRRLNEAKSDF